MAPSAGYATEALALRRLAIGLFTNSSGSDHGSKHPITSDEAWNIFLRIEQCAAALKTRLDSLATHLPVLDRFATQEIQRSLGARAQLAIIAAVARERGSTVVVLKGSVAAADGRATYLKDIDVLVRPLEADDFAGEIARRLGLNPAGRAQTRHLPILGGGSSLPVEVHLSLDSRRTHLTEAAWSRITPLLSAPGLFRLAPRDHCLHLLTHAVIDHPDRRGRLRDALLLRDSLAECSAPEIQEMTAALAQTGYGELLTQELNFVQGMNRSAADPFERPAFVSYWLAEHSLPWSRERRPRWDHVFGTVWQWVLTIASGWPVRRWLFDALTERSADRSVLPVIASMERHFPLLGRAARLMTRTVHYALALALALPLAGFARRAARKAGVLQAG